MIFTGIKRKSNQLFFNKKNKELAAVTSKIASRKIKNVIILLDDISLKDEILNNIKSNLGLKVEAIELVIFQQKKAKDTSDTQIFSSKDFGWYGKIKNENLKGILTKKYDLLINYNKVDNLYNNLLLLQIQAAFKVGFANLDNRFYDLLINCKVDEIELFNKELKKYLEILNKV
ncbi:hypothetical protein MHL31_00085 [Lutibacter sp. A80]|uniref:DUF6913 domain-containing protein n=1 Tax=Lutibacter sp. A80 TaxID=2918453 RepID=UPI001F05988E|nr:hypothetical protein [Lutibacter sp. A80]UMB60628.1 hypothetical protein MHL31_00085 [Lutibacter sp. A80]